MSDPRYALYFCPQQSSMLYRFGCRWLGRDVVTGADLEQPDLFAISPERLRAATASARRYGFHATLKPPFRLVDGMGEADLVEAAQRFAAGLTAFQAPPLVLRDLAGFLALQLSEPSVEMEMLAAACVTGLDHFRAPPSAAEIARRRSSGLTPRHEELLARWGYPFVMEAFRFHMTLTEKLEEEERALFEEVLDPMVDRFAGEKLTVDSVALYREPAPGQPFMLLTYLPFGGK